MSTGGQQALFYASSLAGSEIEINNFTNPGLISKSWTVNSMPLVNDTKLLLLPFPLWLSGPVEEYKVPFEDEVGLHPALEDMQQVVVQKKLRPTLRQEWFVHPVSQVQNCRDTYLTSVPLVSVYCQLATYCILMTVEIKSLECKFHFLCAEFTFYGNCIEPISEYRG